MINDTYNCAYLHVPKTGGTSILKFFLILIGMMKTHFIFWDMMLIIGKRIYDLQIQFQIYQKNILCLLL